MTMIRWRSLPALAAAGLLLACGGGSTDPIPDGTERPPATFEIVQLSATTPIFNDSVSFYAKNSTDTEGNLYFQAAGGGRGERFARIRIKKGTMLSLADGTPIGANDSVLIVMKMTGPRDCQVQLTPSGIKFSSKDPAELSLEYVGVTDFNGDGKIDSADAAAEQKLSIWRQENPGEPYVKIGTVKVEGSSELKAQLTSFSRYAISY